jgi:Ca-activated chloride channel family protein
LPTINIRGKVAGEIVGIDVPAPEEISGGSKTSALGLIWARSKISDLAERSTYKAGQDWSSQVKQVALEYGLMSQFTSFIAVDASHVTGGRESTTVPFAVPVPEGVKYDQTVGKQ